MSRVLTALLISLPALAAEPAIDVSVVIGKARVPLSVEHRFSDVATSLPKAGRMLVEDTHELSHDARTYCYRFGDELLEFFDSDFGVHTARMSRSPDAGKTNCAVLNVRPVFEVAGKRFSLTTKDLPTLGGFTTNRKEQLVRLERGWTYNLDERTCMSRSVSVEGQPGQGGFDRITVMNWEEPGC